MIEWLITSQCTTHEQCNLDAIGTSTKKQTKTTDSCRHASEVNSFNIIPSPTVHSVTEKNSTILAKKNISKPTLQPAACHDELVKATKKKKDFKNDILCCCIWDLSKAWSALDQWSLSSTSNPLKFQRETNTKNTAIIAIKKQSGQNPAKLRGRECIEVYVVHVRAQSVTQHRLHRHANSLDPVNIIHRAHHKSDPKPSTVIIWVSYCCHMIVKKFTEYKISSLQHQDSAREEVRLKQRPQQLNNRQKWMVLSTENRILSVHINSRRVWTSIILDLGHQYGHQSH